MKIMINLRNNQKNMLKSNMMLNKLGIEYLKQKHWNFKVF